MKINKNIIKELSDYLDEFNLTEIEYEENDIRVKVSKSKISSEIRPEVKLNNTDKNTNVSVQKEDGKKITSPIIGTAYLAAEPGGKKFTEPGKNIKKGDTIMIVEAMKTMNHVPCPENGTIIKICVEDGQPVEFGQTIAILK
tara:strand:+ start:1440 stop:1865 length:426 start_codon:yes stop_codon:yes gene_type:complete